MKLPVNPPVVVVSLNSLDVSMATYAIMKLGGLQWRVEAGLYLDVNRLTGDVGSEFSVDQVLLTSDGGKVSVGKPYVSGAKVVCEVMEHRKGPKIITYKFRRRENWRKTVGHRQPLTRVIVTGIEIGGKRVVSKAAAKPVKITKDAKAVKTAKSVKTAAK